MLIGVSRGGFHRLVIPVPLFVLDLTLAAFSDLARLFDLLATRRLRGMRNDRGESGAGRISVESMLTVCLQLFREMRKYGRFRLVEVRAGKNRVSVELY
ncbi:hypothetical protein A6M21_02210 [Desulfotomaculum copahuensis]|uniref:Uncharacterized protein n=2 Tax=Desulfotomaculum copahuensis TaxID=1838280 RepID=A0A1B7LKU2_9FIRM|nr:hypothetical protein A6M21_02210 [Desulfotomaculum copahuensis]